MEDTASSKLNSSSLIDSFPFIAPQKGKGDTRAAVAEEHKLLERKLRAVAEVSKAKRALVEKIASN